MKLSKFKIAAGESLEKVPARGANFVCAGDVSVNGKTYEAEQGFYTEHEQSVSSTYGAHMIVFSVSDKASSSPTTDLLLAQEFSWPENEFVLRLDQVSFPEGGIAYRHIHAGAGIRYLASGQLQIQSDHHEQGIEVGASWFEDVNSPVKAVAKGRGVTRFVRALVLPLAFEGKSTINYLNSEDAEKPKLQSNHRFFDQIVRL